MVQRRAQHSAGGDAIDAAADVGHVPVAVDAILSQREALTNTGLNPALRNPHASAARSRRPGRDIVVLTFSQERGWVE